MTVIVIDDDTFIRNALKRAFRPWQVYDAVTIPEAVWKCAERQPAVILLDARLENEDGIDGLHRLRVASPRSEIIVMTGYYNMTDLERAMNAGAFSYVEKGDLSALRPLVAAARGFVSSSFVHVPPSLH